MLRRERKCSAEKKTVQRRRKTARQSMNIKGVLYLWTTVPYPGLISSGISLGSFVGTQGSTGTGINRLDMCIPLVILRVKLRYFNLRWVLCLGIHRDSRGRCYSIYSGRWLYNTWKGWTTCRKCLPRMSPKVVKAFRLSCSWSWCVIDQMGLYNRHSSAKNWTWEDTHSGRSLI